MALNAALKQLWEDTADSLIEASDKLDSEADPLSVVSEAMIEVITVLAGCVRKTQELYRKQPLPPDRTSGGFS